MGKIGTTKLDEAKVKAIQVYHEQGLTPSRIAGLLDVSEKTVKCHLDPAFREKINKGRALRRSAPEARRRYNYKMRAKRERYWIGTRVNGKVVRLRVDKGKRPKPLLCELCGRVGKFGYHHWDDQAPEKGLWLCLLCHNLAEQADKGLVPRYFELKNLVNLGVA